MKKIDKIIYPVLFFILICIVWWTFLKIFNIPEYLFPSPSSIIHEMFHSKELYSNMLITAAEAITGLLIGSISGFLFAILFSFSKKIELSLMPYAILFKVTPIVAIAPLLILWLGNGFMTKAIISAMLCFFPVLVGTLKGLRLIDANFLKLFNLYGASKSQTFYKLRLPSSVPHLFSGLRVASSLSVVGAIVGEFIGASQGLGYYILVSSYHLNTAVIFSSVIVTAILGIILYYAVVMLEKFVAPWYSEN